MPKIVRTGVFETNSSSSHSVVIARTGVVDRLGDDDGVVTIPVWRYQFGWGWSAHSGVEARAAYAYLLLHDDSSPISEEDRARCFTMLNDCVKARVHWPYGDGPQVVWQVDEPEPGRWPERGYIDHQSVEDGQWRDVFQSPGVLDRFVWDMSSSVECWNDNSDSLPGFDGHSWVGVHVNV
jgi:hypothetical protein